MKTHYFLLALYYFLVFSCHQLWTLLGSNHNYNDLACASSISQSTQLMRDKLYSSTYALKTPTHYRLLDISVLVYNTVNWRTSILMISQILFAMLTSWPFLVPLFTNLEVEVWNCQGNLQKLTCIPSRWERGYSQSFHANKAQDKYHAEYTRQFTG